MQELFGGVNSATALGLPPCVNPKHEYGIPACTVELVDTLEAAIDHVHKYGSSHTECIVTEDQDTAEKWLSGVVRSAPHDKSRPLISFIAKFYLA